MVRLIERMTRDYLEDVLVRLAHHSSAIEGNTITLPETVTIILNNTLPNNAKISRREFYEVDNHQQTFEYVINMIENNEKLSIPILKNIHEKLTDRLQHDKGKFKVDENYIKGVELSTAPPDRVPQLMDQLIENLYFRIENSETDEDILKAIFETHIQFEKIHPFSDGNGRTGRMVMNYSLLDNDLPPLIINKENKGLYNQILHEAQIKSFPSENDIKVFYEFTAPFLLKEKQRIESFNYKEKNQMVDFNGVKKVNKNRNGGGNGMG